MCTTIFLKKTASRTSTDAPGERTFLTFRARSRAHAPSQVRQAERGSDGAAESDGAALHRALEPAGHDGMPPPHHPGGQEGPALVQAGDRSGPERHPRLTNRRGQGEF